MLNVVALMGRLVADPQLRQTTTGKNVASFRVAVDRGRKDANGQNQADFFDIVAWDKSAEFVCRYFQKGSMIAVEGRLQSRNYQDKSGNNRNAVEVVVNNVSFAGNKEPAQSQNVANRAVSAPVAANNEYEPIEDDGDLPFNF
jgi:single-strand DNA-binding protein